MDFTSKKAPPMVSMEGVMAEREGFEPSLPFGKRALQARALDRTMRPLQIYVENYSPFQRARLYHSFFFKSVFNLGWMRYHSLFSPLPVIYLSAIISRN